ncbi:MAG: alkaline phosphatase family protein [Clostridia bacterium]|nr:alkaline phosphatase family protein [Clostridia bacterium]
MSNQKHSHVVVVGIDGAGSFIKDAVTPHFDRIFANGAVTYRALASNPSISAECWGSMLTGVGPEVHKLTNGIVSKTPYPTDSAFPSLFRRIRAVMPDAELGSYCDWNPITFGIVENNIGVSHDTARDTELTPIICDYIKTKKPTFLFIQMDSVDGAGHAHDYGSEKHLERINVVDGYINNVHEAIKDAGMLEETLFIVIADHGGKNCSHGGWSDEEKYVTFAAAGKGVQKISIEEMNIRDLAAIVLYALGIDAPELDEKGWTSQIPTGIFDDPAIPEYRDFSHLTGAAPRISKVAHTSELL